MYPRGTSRSAASAGSTGGKSGLPIPDVGTIPTTTIITTASRTTGTPATTRRVTLPLTSADPSTRSFTTPPRAPPGGPWPGRPPTRGGARSRDLPGSPGLDGGHRHLALAVEGGHAELDPPLLGRYQLVAHLVRGDPERRGALQPSRGHRGAGYLLEHPRAVGQGQRLVVARPQVTGLGGGRRQRRDAGRSEGRDAGLEP